MQGFFEMFLDSMNGIDKTKYTHYNMKSLQKIKK